jgi:hypothetical protein
MCKHGDVSGNRAIQALIRDQYPALAASGIRVEILPDDVPPLDGILATLGDAGTLYAGPWTCRACGTDEEHCGWCGFRFDEPCADGERACQRGEADDD